MKPGERERGFALLLVFVLAAAIALLLYRELPRVAFEAQRNREALLIERGEGYQRAIQLYFRQFKKYPVKIEDLENTNQLRFLRKRYDDPLTGKSEWRLIHIGPGGIFTDSLTHKPPGQDKDKDPKAANTFTYEAPQVGSTLPDPSQNASGFAPVRPSEKAGLPPLPGQQPGLVAGNPNQFPPGQGFPPGVLPGVNPLQPGQQPGQQPYGQPGTYAGAAVNSQNGGVAAGGAFPYSTQPGAQGTGANGFAQPGTNTNPNGQPPNQALNLINQILTTPRQNFNPGNQTMAGLQISPGIAGVASTVERKGIKIYNDKEKYNEWEFIYDLTKDTAGTAATAGISGAGSLNQQGNASPFSPQQPAPGQQQAPGQQPQANQPQTYQPQPYQPQVYPPQPYPPQPYPPQPNQPQPNQPPPFLAPQQLPLQAPPANP